MTAYEKCGDKSPQTFLFTIKVVLRRESTAIFFDFLSVARIFHAKGILILVLHMFANALGRRIGQLTGESRDRQELTQAHRQVQADALAERMKAERAGAEQAAVKDARYIGELILENLARSGNGVVHIRTLDDGRARLSPHLLFCSSPPIFGDKQTTVILPGDAKVTYQIPGGYNSDLYFIPLPSAWTLITPNPQRPVGQYKHHAVPFDKSLESWQVIRDGLATYAENLVACWNRDQACVSLAPLKFANWPIHRNFGGGDFDNFEDQMQMEMVVTLLSAPAKT